MKKPLVTVIIPSYSRSSQLEQCLDRLKIQNYPRDRFEVVVVDDGSVPALESALQEQYKDINLKLSRISNSGAAAARNHGVELSSGSLLVFTDDDCLPDKDWLGAFTNAHAKHADSLLGGSVQNAFEDNPYATCSQLILDCAYAFYNPDPENARFFASCNIAIPATEYKKIGGFSAAFRVASEDRELCYRWHQSGLRLRSIPSARVKHAKKLNFGDFLHQHFRYGQGAFHYHRIRSSSGLKLLAGASFRYAVFVTLLVQSVFRQPWRRVVPLTGLMMLAQLANLSGFIKAALVSPGGLEKAEEGPAA